MQDKINSKTIKNIKKSDLIKKGGKLKSIDKKKLLKLARTIATGFDDVDLNNISNYKYRKAQETVKLFANSMTHGGRRLVRPSAKNRAAYAEFADVPANFKLIPMPILEKNDTFRVKKGQVVRKGDHITTNDYLFPDRKKAMLNTEAETNKLIKRIDKDYKGKIKQLFIRVGAHETKVKYPISTVGQQIEQWTMQYGIEKTTKFVMGLRVFSFEGQEVKRPSRQKMKKGYKKK